MPEKGIKTLQKKKQKKDVSTIKNISRRYLSIEKLLFNT